MRSAWLDIPQYVEAAKQTAKTGATEFCIVAAVRGPDEQLMDQVAAGIAAIKDTVDINRAGAGQSLSPPPPVPGAAGAGAYTSFGQEEGTRS